MRPRASVPTRARRFALVAACIAAVASAAAGGELRSRVRHFASNANFDASGAYLPAADGFDIADVAGRAQLDRLPEGVKGLVWIGSCSGVDATFAARVDAVAGHPKLYGFYLMDDPDPTGRWRPLCRAAALRAEAAYVHKQRPDAIAFVALMNLGSSAAPAFSRDYAPERTGIDVFGVAPYPCRTGWTTCDFDMIDRFVAAAVASGVPIGRIAPIYQTFGGGGWRSDGGGAYRIPSPDELRAMLARWDRLVPSPPFDYAYAWGRQRFDDALEGAPGLRAVFAARQSGGGASGAKP